MSRIMETLHTDHIHIDRLLRLLSAQMDILHDGGTPDYQMLTEIVDYVEHYPDLVHHPKEDLMFTTYLAHNDERREDIESLMEEHKTLLLLTKDFKELLEEVMDDAIISRDEVENAGRDYIRRQRNHLNSEEAEIFPLINRTLTEEEWKYIEEHAPAADDPLFGRQVEKRYESLYRLITSS